MGRDILTKRCERSFLQLLKGTSTTLPKLANVRSLEIGSPFWRKLHPAAGPLLASSLPRLEHINWELPDCDEESVHVWRDNQVELAEALNFSPLPPRSTAKIRLFHISFFDQRIDGASSMIPSGLSYDQFSSCLRTFSYNRASLTVKARLASTIF